MTQDMYSQLRQLHREFDDALGDLAARAICWVVDPTTYKEIVNENGRSIFMMYDPQSSRRGAHDYNYTGWTVGGLPFRIVHTGSLPRDFPGASVPTVTTVEKDPKLLAIEYYDRYSLRHTIYSKDTDPALIHTPPRPEKVK